MVDCGEGSICFPGQFTGDLLTRLSWGSLNDIRELLAEGEGFEPPDLAVNGFQDRRLKPLGHPSEENASPEKAALSSCK